MRAGLPAAVTTTAFPILLRSWTTKSRLVPTPTGSGRDDPLRARRRRRSDPAERLLRRGRIRPRHRKADSHCRVAAPGQPASARRAAHHVRSTAVHRRDEARWVGGNAQHVARTSVPLVLQLDDAGPPCGHEAVFGRDEKGVQQDQNADGDELEEDRHAPTPWALVLGGISSSNYGEV